MLPGHVLSARTVSNTEDLQGTNASPGSGAADLWRGKEQKVSRAAGWLQMVWQEGLSERMTDMPEQRSEGRGAATSGGSTPSPQLRVTAVFEEARGGRKAQPSVMMELE